ncbi:MAPEG family protein [Chelatococcus sp. GCM10030263]|uniref:MAPEG family protein n=1 Tax=Chelatococcus sp. GCM10030263 TaxID=3273387 RepID=UPI00360B4C6D
MSIATVLLPVFVEVALTFGLLFWAGFLRTRELRSGRVRREDVRLDDHAFPDKVRQVANCYGNQLQLPVLFYVVVALALFTRQADFLFVLLSWVFVITRLAHAFVHTGSNDIAVRGPVFGIGGIVLAVMWAIFAVKILTGI